MGPKLHKLFDLGSPQPPFSEDENTFLQRLMESLGFEQLPPGWDPVSGEHENRNVLPELILIHTKRVKHVRLAIDSQSQLASLRRYGEMLATKTGGRGVILPSLTSLDVEHFPFPYDDPEIPFDEIAFGVLRAAPAVEYLSLPSFQAEGGWNTPGWHGGDELSNLRELQMGPRCDTSPQWIEKVVSSSPKLESSRLHWAPLSWDLDLDEGDSEQRTVAYMWEILGKSHCRHGLREIALHVRPDTPAGQIDGTWSGLGEFRNLEVLNLNITALSPLIHADSGPAFQAGMERLAWDVAEGLFSSLKRVVVVGPSGASEGRYAADDPWSGGHLKTWGWPNPGVIKLTETFARGGDEFVVEEHRDSWWHRGAGMCRI
ncbi:hypothetical protein V8F33_013619, partial [Rhypophila sp. PSN 637]